MNSDTVITLRLLHTPAVGELQQCCSVRKKKKWKGRKRNGQGDKKRAKSRRKGGREGGREEEREEGRVRAISHAVMYLYKMIRY